jgi:hypothetical protein
MFTVLVQVVRGVLLPKDTRVVGTAPAPPRAGTG